MKKTGRNDPCPCGSGKKFKKCCEAKAIGGKFVVTRIEEATSNQIQKTVHMASFFQARLAGTPKKPEPIPQSEVQESSPEKEKIC